MTTPLVKSMTREVLVSGTAYKVTMTNEHLKLVRKGGRKGIERATTRNRHRAHSNRGDGATCAHSDEEYPQRDRAGIALSHQFARACGRSDDAGRRASSHANGAVGARSAVRPRGSARSLVRRAIIHHRRSSVHYSRLDVRGSPVGTSRGSDRRRGTIPAIGPSRVPSRSAAAPQRNKAIAPS